MAILSSSNIHLRQRVQAAVLSFDVTPLRQAASGLLHALGYASEKIAEIGTDPEEFLSNIEEFGPVLKRFDRAKVRFADWKSCSFVFQLTNDEIPSLVFSPGQVLLGADKKVVRSQIESFVFLAIELKGEKWSRSDLALITREINRRFPMPAIIIFRHGDLLSIAVIDRRASFRDSSLDVIDDRITVIKDIRVARPHRAHLEILASLALENLGDRQRPSNFADLYKAWIEALSTHALNKRFYTELAWWYFWAVKQVEFPLGGGQDPAKRHSVAVIRLLTRIIFIWFIKEKGLVPEGLFDPQALKQLLKSDPSADPEGSNYYRAVLQNLFFATLNVEMGSERKWADDGGGMKGDRLVHSLYRYRGLFSKPDSALDLFLKIPYLNGGLFECLDRDLTEREFQRNPELRQLATKEGNSWVLRIDGFSRRPDAQPKVPNKLFFNGEEGVDLSQDLGTSKKLHSIDGLIDLFGRYKFTVDENTPIEEEVALDPELLGKVFENLLASYNEDTKTTARKLSGSFYTPREVVDYMVDEALVAALENHISSADKKGSKSLARSDDETEDDYTVGIRLRRLLSYGTDINEFSQTETKSLISGVESLRILDPACGSGAFPMGALAKLVHVLKKLDPHNALWRQQNRKPLEEQLDAAKRIPDPSLREDKVLDAEDALRKLDRDFSNAAHADYTRKLYLIEKCIHGIDIQPIAVQIAKLRFFISLIVSQEVDPKRENWGITALPNLETKIVAADSLTPIDRPSQLPLRDLSIGVKEQELVTANEYYFAARTSRTKRKWRDRIFDLRDELARLLEQDLFLSKGAAAQLVHWNPFDQNASADFFDPEWMFQIRDGFDIVIGNPPYVNAGSIRDIKPKLRLSFRDFFDGNSDLFTYFYRRGFDLLRTKGILAYISSNKFMRAGYGIKTRKLLSREAALRVIIDFGELPVFGASVDSAIVIVEKPDSVAPSNPFRAVIIREKEEIPIAGQILAERGEIHQSHDLSDAGWLFESLGIRDLLDRITEGRKRLDDIVHGRFYYGIKTGFNDAFVISGATKASLISRSPNSSEVIKPFLNGKEMLRWRCDFSDKWLLYIPWHFPLQHDPSVSGASPKAEREFKRQYPEVYKHLLDNKPALLARNQDETGIRYEWYALQRWGAEYWQEIEKRKIVFNETSKELHAFIDEKSLYINKTGFMIIHEEDEYLLGILNSSVLDYYYRHKFPSWGDPWKEGRIQFRKDRMVDAPIPWPEKRRRDLVAGCVRAVSEMYQRLSGAVSNTSAARYEELINGLVFELFFPEDMRKAGIQLFDAAEKVGIPRLATLKDKELMKTAESLATLAFANDHQIYAMLFDLRAVDVYRMIEGHQ